MSTLYFKAVVDLDEGGHYAWEEPLNWFTDAAATTAAANAPWVDGVDSTYLSYDLELSTGETISPLMNFAGGIDGYGLGATGTCSFDVVVFSGTSINGGAFSGGVQNNGATINAGAFSGAFYSNGGYINGGTFSASGSTSESGFIYGGTFSGDGFTNLYGSVYGGTFSGDGVVNSYGTINDGTFSGDGFVNSYGTINGGTFSGSGFTNLFDGGNGYINGGTFTGSGLSLVGNEYGLAINGGTYAPITSVTFGQLVSGDQVDYGNIPPNPGFGIKGGVFAPDTSVTEIPQPSDILGTGLL